MNQNTENTNRVDGLLTTAPAAEASARPEGRSTPPGPVAPSMAVSVTRHALITKGDSEERVESRFLLCGVDTLDVGLYVDWGPRWQGLEEEFEAQRLYAGGTDGVQWSKFEDGEAVFYPSGKRPNYRYHFKTSVGHFFIVRSREAYQSPNVDVSVASKWLWNNGVEAVQDCLATIVEGFGGRICATKVSRCDICADFLIPGGLTERFLRQHQVSRTRKVSVYADGDDLETYYLGSKLNPIQLRIYDKGKEVRKKGAKLWFVGLWGLEDCQDIWRVEYQLRRVALKEFGVEGLETLRPRLPGIWQHLTTEWVSLRVSDDSNTSRQSVHPWWQSVLETAGKLGEITPIGRIRRKACAPDIRRPVSMVGGLFVSYAAMLGLSDPIVAWDYLRAAVFESNAVVGFAERYTSRRAKLGWPEAVEEAEPTQEADEVPF